MTSLVESRVNKAIEKFNKTMNAHTCATYESLSKLNRLASSILKSDMNSIYSDLWACVRCGFANEKEVSVYISDCEKAISKTKAKYTDALISRIGEEEYYIQWLMCEHGYKTREEALAYLTELEENWGKEVL